MLSTFYAILVSISVVAAIVCTVSAYYAKLAARKAKSSADLALARAKAYTAMREGWEASAKQAQLFDRGIRETEIRLGKRSAKSGTVIGYKVKAL